jgi:hypothetical protein
MKITIEKLLSAKNYCLIFSSNKLTKFSYACKKTLERIDKALEQHEELMAGKRIELAITGESGEIITDEKGGYKFTPENLKKLNDIFNEEKKKEVDFEPYFTENYSEIQDNLHVLEALNGIVFNVNIEELIS